METLPSVETPVVMGAPFRVHSTVFGMGTPSNSHSSVMVVPSGTDWELESDCSPLIPVDSRLTAATAGGEGRGEGEGRGRGERDALSIILCTSTKL